jgi:ABC-type molybdate transport system ATPase subunit
MFCKKIMVRVDNKNKIAMATAWGLMDSCLFPKYTVRENHTVFYMTKKQKESFDSIVKLYKY